MFGGIPEERSYCPASVMIVLAIRFNPSIGNNLLENRFTMLISSWANTPTSRSVGASLRCLFWLQEIPVGRHSTRYRNSKVQLRTVKLELDQLAISSGSEQQCLSPSYNIVLFDQILIEILQRPLYFNTYILSDSPNILQSTTWSS
jgi:hypothetical protein